MNVKPIETKYGLIIGRDALIISETELSLYPLNFVIKTSLSLSCCEPSLIGAFDVNVNFLFSNIKKLTIYSFDDYPYEKKSKSCFDLIDDTKEDKIQHIILSTYDHIFDIIGNYEIKYSQITFNN